MSYVQDSVLNLTCDFRAEEKAELTPVPENTLKMKAQPPDSTVTGAAEPPPTHEASGEEEQTEEENVEGEDIKAPLKLIIEFLRAVMDRDFQLASRLCQMILVYEPTNPEASEFLPLLRQKLLEERETEHSTEEEGDDDSGSDDETSGSSCCSSSSCSSPSPSGDDVDKGKRVNRHKPCPPSHVCP